MIILNREGTKCSLCGKDLNGTTLQSTSFICRKCGTHFEPICAGHICPNCYEPLEDAWNYMNRIGQHFVF